MARASIARGLTAGLLAAAALATWFLLIDVVKKQPLFTAAYMSGLLFSSTTALPATARVLVFVLLHFAVFALIGAIVALLFATLHITQPVLFVLPVGLALCGLLYSAVSLGFGVNVARTLGWWELLGGNIVAAAAMIGWLRRSSKASSPRRPA